MGLLVYGVFDMTNMAILKNYPIPFLLADMAWGTVVFGIVSVLTWKVTANYNCRRRFIADEVFLQVRLRHLRYL